MARSIRPTLLPALLLLTLLFVSHCVDAAAAKKGAKSSKKTPAANTEKKAAPAKKDWNKMTEDEWNAAEQEALDPEDRCDPSKWLRHLLNFVFFQTRCTDGSLSSLPSLLKFLLTLSTLKSSWPLRRRCQPHTEPCPLDAQTQQQ